MASASDDPFLPERQSLLSRLLDAVKQCQIRFGGRTELATESDSRVVCLCAQFESVLQHGIRKNSKGLLAFRQVTEMMKGLNLRNVDGDTVFWQFVRTILNKHELDRYMLLKNIATDMGRGRAWLRSALNEHSLERYMHMLLSDGSHISQFYEDWAFLMDEERSSMLPMMAAGLGSILFAINIDNPDLNICRITRGDELDASGVAYEPAQNAPQPIIKSTGNSLRHRKKRTKRPAAQVVSFDDEDLNTYQEGSLNFTPECKSAPPTCLSSPVVLTGNFVQFSDSPIDAIHTHPESDDLERISISVTKDDKCLIPEQNIIAEDHYSSCDVSPKTFPSETVSSQKQIPVDDLTGGSVTDSTPADVSKSSDEDTQSLEKDNNATHLQNPITNSNNLTEDTVNLQDIKLHEGSNDLHPLASVSSSASLASDGQEQCLPCKTTLTPIDDASVGELIPVTQVDDIPSSEDSVSIPSFGEDTENAAAALILAQRVASWSVSSSSSQNTVTNLDKRGSEPRSRSDTMTMTTDELREALLTVLQRKEETEEKNISLRSLLDREMELSAGLRAELEEAKKQNEEKSDRLENKVHTLSRENDLLKHQLKKYIAAVQMLKKEGSRGHDAISGLVGDVQPAIPEPRPYIDHQYEANEYEKKLVQVAEMHGELMEFNERLHKLLLQREATIRRLREELVDLRGPLPDDNQTSDDDVSITSDYDASSQSAALRPFINIWIPSAFLTGRTTDVHHVYQVYVRIRDDEWNIYRRYAQFYAFHKVLKKKDPIVNSFDFPPKKTIRNKDAKVVEERRRRLQHYLRCVVNWILQVNVDLANNPDREVFISLLPFFGEQPERKKESSTTVTSNRLRLPGISNTPQSQERRVQHYTGL